VPFIDRSSRVGRSQGASIFWGLVSVFFAAAACFYFWKSHENESTANKYRDEVYTLQEVNDALAAEKEKLQASMSDSAGQMKAREDFLDEKEAKLAAQETKLEALAQKSPGQASATPPAATPKKFSDTIHKLSEENDAEVTMRNGRPVLRLPNSSFFDPGDATLKPDGQALLNQIAQSLSSQSDSFELRIECFTDTDAEATSTPAAKTDKPDKDAKKDKPSDATVKPKYANGWELTAARSAAIAHYLRDQGSLTFQNVLVTARGDSQPIASGAKDHARNRRIEFSVTPIPAAIHSSSSAPADTSTNSLTPPPEPSAPPAKAK
jgi:chemotaxis protein MotB